jgi:hypothetical protein
LKKAILVGGAILNAEDVDSDVRNCRGASFVKRIEEAGEFVLGKRSQQVCRGGVVAKGFAHVGKAVLVARAEDETASELKGIFAQLVLTMPARFGSFAGDGVFLAE